MAIADARRHQHRRARTLWLHEPAPDMRRYGCRWCGGVYRLFHDLVEHSDQEHPVEFEEAITRRRAMLVPARPSQDGGDLEGQGL